MIIVPTHKCHKSPFQHSKIIYVFTSKRVIVTMQLHNRIVFLKGLKWTLQNGPLILYTNKIFIILLQDLM
jgi:hypothetical protein